MANDDLPAKAHRASISRYRMVNDGGNLCGDRVDNSHASSTSVNWPASWFPAASNRSEVDARLIKLNNTIEIIDLPGFCPATSGTISPWPPQEVLWWTDLLSATLE